MAQPNYLGIASFASVLTDPISDSVSVPAGATRALVVLHWYESGGPTPTAFNVSLGSDSGSLVGTAVDTFGRTSQRYNITIASPPGTPENRTLSIAPNSGTTVMTGHILFFSNVDSVAANGQGGTESTSSSASQATNTNPSSDTMLVASLALWPTDGATLGETATADSPATQRGDVFNDNSVGNLWDTRVVTSTLVGAGSSITAAFTIGNVGGISVRNITLTNVVGGSGGGGGAVTSPYYFMRSRRTAA